MSDINRILITGIGGFIGRALAQSLSAIGYEVWGIDYETNVKRQIISTNLLNLNELIESSKKLPKCSVIIHTAALAHGQKAPNNETVITNNVKITENLLEVFSKKIKHILFISSVAVYGEDKRNQPVSVSDNLRPSTDYGKSKLLCEQLILKSDINNCTVLRLSSVYDQKHMLDIRKRVFLPGLSSLKLVIKPSPKYSFTNIDTVVKTVSSIVKNRPNGKNIYNISDPKVYSQKILATWFPGKEIPIPVIVTKPFYWLTYLLPKIYGYKIRCLYWKLFKSNVYKVNYK